jgi:hypothetical protein
MSKAKVGGCKKKQRAHKVSKGQRRSIARPFGGKPDTLGCHRQSR